MRKSTFVTLILFGFIPVYSQIIYEQPIDRLKGGGSGIYNLFTFTYELGYIKLDSAQLIYSKNNKKKYIKDLVIPYKDIYAIKRQNYLLIIPVKLVIKTKNGTNYYFMTFFNRKKLIKTVRLYIKTDD